MNLRKSSLFILLCSAIGTVVWAQTMPSSVPAANLPGLADLLVDRNTGLRTLAQQPFTGEAVSYYPDGVQAAAEQFKAGRRHGYVKRWFADGSLAFSAHYENGKRQGRSSSWWRNGNQRSVTQYVDDVPNGEALQWYRGGEPFKRMQYLAGQPVGLQQGWRKNGKLFSNYEYRNGRAYGLRNANLCVELEDEEIVIDRK